MKPRESGAPDGWQMRPGCRENVCEENVCEIETIRGPYRAFTL
jgi:hypothetical protein